MSAAKPTSSVRVLPLYARRYDVTSEKVEFCNHLEEHGFAIAASVLDPLAVDDAKDMMWKLLIDASGGMVDRHDVSTWDVAHGWKPNVKNGLFNTHGAGQSDFLWSIRLQPKVKEAFRAIYDDSDDLLVSFTGCNAFRPWQYNPSWRTKGGWYHVDQNAKRQGRAGKVCVQGIVTLCDADAGSGGLVVVPGSQKRHEELCDTHPLAVGVGDYLPLSEDHVLLQSGAKLVCAKAGDLIVWDSRTIHCNTDALDSDVLDVSADGSCSGAIGSKNDAESELHDLGRTWELIRMVAYVCMMPSSLTSDEVVDQRWHAYENNLGSSHWTDRVVPCGANDLPLNSLVGLSEEKRNLVGRRRVEKKPKEDESQMRSRCTIM